MYTLSHTHIVCDKAVKLCAWIGLNYVNCNVKVVILDAGSFTYLLVLVQLSLSYLVSGALVQQQEADVA